MTVYRRSKSAAANAPWHFSRDCRKDPKENFDLRFDQPRYSDLCYQCKTGKEEPASSTPVEPVAVFRLRLCTEPLRPIRPVRETLERAA